MNRFRSFRIAISSAVAASTVLTLAVAQPASADGTTAWRPPPVCAPHNQGSSPLSGDWTYVGPPQYEYPVIGYRFIYTLEYDPSPVEACYVYVG